MTLRQLEIFCAVVEQGGFTSAARKLFLSQPSVSQQVHLLEEELGEALFVRLKNRTVLLTEAGKLLRSHAALALRQCEVARMEIAGFAREPVGGIRIGIGLRQLAILLPQLLGEFHSRFPKVCVEVVHDNTPQLVERLESNQLDLAVISLAGPARKLRTRLLFSEEYVVVLPKSDPLAKRRFIHPSKLAELPLILYSPGMSSGKQIEDYFRQAGVVPNVICRLDSSHAVKLLVEAGLGATLVPFSDVFSPDAGGSLCALRIRGAPLSRRVLLATPRVSLFPRVTETMLELIVQLCPKAQVRPHEPSRCPPAEARGCFRES